MDIQITGDYITLTQFLKAANLVSTGGAAKFYIQENDIYVNGTLEKRRGKKLRRHDTILIDKQKYKIV